jgi:hypothetical protein
MVHYSEDGFSNLHIAHFLRKLRYFCWLGLDQLRGGRDESPQNRGN